MSIEPQGFCSSMLVAHSLCTYWLSAGEADSEMMIKFEYRGPAWDALLTKIHQQEPTAARCSAELQQQYSLTFTQTARAT
jgi:hypothetical protein